MWWKGSDSSGGVPPILLLIALLVAGVWAVATLVAVALPNHPVSPSLNATMGGTVTALFSLVGVIAARSSRNGGGSSSNESRAQNRSDNQDRVERERKAEAHGKVAEIAQTGNEIEVGEDA